MTQERPNNALATVPNSLKAQLDRAQNLLAQSETAESRGDHTLAVVKAREGMRVLKALAESSPNHAALIIAAEMGFRGYEIETVEHIDKYEIVEQKFLGITIGHDVVHVPTTTRRTIRARFI
jgi:hypothetical protein